MALADIAAQTAAQVAGPAVPLPGQLGLEQLKAAARRIQSGGCQFRAREDDRSYAPWAKATPEATAVRAHEAVPGRLEASRDGKDWVPLADGLDLLEFDAFYGRREPGLLAQGAVGVALAQLEQDGAEFNFSRLGNWRNVGAFGAYNVLAEDPRWEGKITLRHGDFKRELDSIEDAVLAAYLLDAGSADALRDPRKAESLKGLEQAGFTFGYRGAAGVYHSLFGEHPPVYVLINHGPRMLFKVPPQDLDDPEALVDRAKGLRTAYDRLKSALGNHKFDQAWKTVLEEDDRSLDERVDLAAALFKLSPSDPADLFGVMLELTPQGEPFDLELAREVAEVHRYGKAAPAYRHLARGLDEIPGSRDELKAQYLQLLGQCGSPEAAFTMLHVLSRAKAPDALRGLFAEWQERWQGPEVLAQAVESLAGGKRKDRAVIESLLGDDRKPRAEAPQAYAFMNDQIPRKLWDSFREMFQAEPVMDTLREAWQEVTAEGSEVVPARAAAWLGLHQAMARNSDRGAEATRALARLEGWELETGVRSYLSVLEGGRGDPEAASQAWKRIASTADPELHRRLYACTGTVEEAVRAHHFLLRHQVGVQIPLEQRAEALEELIRSRRGDLGPALEDYRFVVLWGETSGDLAGHARLFTGLGEALGSSGAARTALAALHRSPPRPGSATAADSLLRSVEAARDLTLARPIWAALEDGPRDERLALLEAADTMAGGQSWNNDGGWKVAEIFEHLLTAPVGAAGLEALKEVAGTLSGGDRQEELMAILGEVLRPEDDPGQRSQALQAFLVLTRETGGGDAALPFWGRVRADVGSSDFEDSCVAAGILQSGLREGAPEAFDRIASDRRPGETLAELARFMQRVGSDDYDSTRQRLEAGTVEGDGLVANTRFYAQLGEQAGDAAAELWQAVTVPIGLESTADRQNWLLDFLKQHQGEEMSDCAESWADLTSWLPAGEDTADSVRAYGQLLAAVGRDTEVARAAARSIREKQMAGSELSFAQSAARTIQSLLAGEALDDALAHLSDPNGGRIERFEEEVRVGGVRLPVKR